MQPVCLCARARPPSIPIWGLIRTPKYTSGDSHHHPTALSSSALQLGPLKNRLVMDTGDANLAVFCPDLASHVGRPLPGRDDPALDDALNAHGHGSQIRTAQRPAHVSTVQEARPRDGEQDG